MTGNDSFGSYPTGGGQGQPPAGMPGQPQWVPPLGGPWGTGAPQWAPPPAPRRSRGPWIIGAVVVVVVAVVVAIVVVARQFSPAVSPAPVGIELGIAVDGRETDCAVLHARRSCRRSSHR